VLVVTILSALPFVHKELCTNEMKSKNQRTELQLQTINNKVKDEELTKINHCKQSEVFMKEWRQNYKFKQPSRKQAVHNLECKNVGSPPVCREDEHYAQ
jgi:beta-N-acetylglucosaminidase